MSASQGAGIIAMCHPAWLTFSIYKLITLGIYYTNGKLTNTGVIGLLYFQHLEGWKSLPMPHDGTSQNLFLIFFFGTRA